MITFTDVVKRYGSLTVLDHVNLTIQEGQLMIGDGRQTVDVEPQRWK